LGRHPGSLAGPQPEGLAHGARRAIDRAVERAGKVDLWLHAGDCAPDAAYLALVSAVRVENVAGNTDWPDGRTPDEIVVEAHRRGLGG